MTEQKELWNRITSGLEELSPEALMGTLIHSYSSDYESYGRGVKIFQLKALCILARKLNLKAGRTDDSLRELEEGIDKAASSVDSDDPETQIFVITPPLAKGPVN